MRSMVVKTEKRRGTSLFTLGERAAGKPVERQGRIFEWGEMEAEGTLSPRNINGQKGVMHSGNWSHSFFPGALGCSVRSYRQSREMGAAKSGKGLCTPAKEGLILARRLNQGLIRLTDWEVFLATVWLQIEKIKSRNQARDRRHGFGAEVGWGLNQGEAGEKRRKEKLQSHVERGF